MKLKFPIFIRVRDQTEIVEFGQLVHALFAEKTLDWWEAKCYLEDFDLTLVDIDSSEICLCYHETWYPTKITIYSSGKVKVETDLDEV